MKEQFDALNNIIARTNGKLNTIVELLNRGEMKLTETSLIVSDDIEIKTVFENKATVSVAEFKCAGCTMHPHEHTNVAEYLICANGKVNVHYNDTDHIVNYKECVLVPNDTLHTVTALEDNTELIAVCIPAEIGYKRRYYNGERNK